MIPQFIERYGMTGFIGVLLLLVLRWVMIQAEKHTQFSREREERLNGIIDTYNERLGEHTKNSIENQNEHKRANEYQRNEHSKQIEILDEIVKTVGRINGYRKP